MRVTTNGGGSCEPLATKEVAYVNHYSNRGVS